VFRVGIRDRSGDSLDSLHAIDGKHDVSDGFLALIYLVVAIVSYEAGQIACVTGGDLDQPSCVSCVFLAEERGVDGGVS
jgi:hypothetical protein